MSHRLRALRVLSGLIVLTFLVAACQPQSVTVEVTRAVEVTRSVEVEVEVTRQVDVVQTVEVPTGGELVTLVARCKASPPIEDGRCNNLLMAVVAANAALEASGDDRRIQVEAIQDNKDWGEYKTEFELASDAGEAPDIIVSGHEHIGDWAPAGLIVDVTDMLGDYPEFDGVIDSLWESTEWSGRRWGVPQDAEARPLYWSKPLLKQLGWTDEEVESLPDRIASGEFTFDDMLATAEEAVQQGVVQPGNGFWHRPSNGPDFLYYYYGAGGEILGDGDKLVFDRQAALTVYQMFEDITQNRQILTPTRLDGDWTSWHSGVSSAEQVLFWAGGSWNWPDWAVNYVKDRGGQTYLFENIGFGPIPAWIKGSPVTLTHPLVYMVGAQSEHPDLALLLISKATTDELNTPYAIASGHLGILESQATHEPYTKATFLSQVLPLLEYTTYLPNSPAWSAWSEAYYLGIQSVESGDLSAEEALEVVTEQLQNELGENVEIVG